MQLTSTAFADGERIPAQYAFCKPSAVGHVALSQNHNPPLAWSGVPDAARSLVLVCHDPDVPSRADDVNIDGRTVPADLARVDFYHWVLVDIPTQRSAIAAAEMSREVTPRGKPAAGLPDDMRHGLNDYTAWFAGDQDMAGQYFGYDGPCPPWNDSLVHHYVFTLYAVDLARCPVEGAFTGAEVRAAIAGHVIAQATLTGLYTLNPALR